MSKMREWVNLLNENADYDHGHSEPNDQPYRIAPHDFRSHSDMKVRYTGNYADNAMDNPAKLNEGDSDDLDRLHEMLAKAGISDDEIADGIDLSDGGIQKVAAAFGIPATDVPMLVNSLVERVRNELNVVEEKVERFSVEEDFLGNVTIRDSLSGKEVFMRGTEASDVLNRLSAEPDREQAILASYASLMEEGAGYEEEMTQGGTYNFPWNYGEQSGNATARYGMNGDKPFLDIISVRDNDGKEVEADEKMKESVLEQARDFIASA